MSGIFVPKLPKSDNWFSSYSRKCWGCFWDTVYNRFTSFQVSFYSSRVKFSLTVWITLTTCDNRIIIMSLPKNYSSHGVGANCSLNILC